uniref:SSD domain-containing protein n=1 Tax=Panagrolaimus sp. PS1159 TaxID=55785 RepID=A0AC35GK39_9BILA
GVGVDDAFILIECWTNSKYIKSKKERISAVLVNIGPSITITSLTNTIAFGIGYATPTPQMSLFCLCTSIALFVDYILVFTFLTPAIYLLTKEDVDTEIYPTSKKELLQLSEFCPRKLPRFVEWYADFVTSKKGIFSVSLFLTCIYVISYFGVVTMKSNFEPSKAFPSDSPLANSMDTVRSVFNEFFPINIIVNHPPNITNSTEQFIYLPKKMPIQKFIRRPKKNYYNYQNFVQENCHVLLNVTMKSNFEPSKAFPSDSPLANSMDTVRSVFNEFFPINIIVNHPPNITNSTEYKEFNKMVEELESMPESYGKDRTLLWLRHYEEMDRHASKLFSFLGFGSENYKPTLDYLDFFLDTIENGTTKLEAFQFTIIAKNLAEWSNRAITEEECRQILLKYPQFNATIFDGDAAILDLLLTVKTDLIGSIAVTIACMTVICSFFIHTQTGVAVVALIISSICFTLVGFLSWWGADLDPVTMVDVLLATGFSVDFTAHIAHQYYAKKGTKRDRIAISIHEMSMPMIEAGTSTVLCMLPLIFVPTYAIVAFAKTVFLVVGIGLIHGLFVLPVMIVNVPEKLSIFSSCQKQQTEPLTAATTGTKRDRIAISIHEMSMPMIEAGTSTVLCMLPLIFVPTYAIVAFAKTVFLVVGIGLIHGLFVLPVMIVNVPEKLSIFSSCQKQQTEPLTAATTVTTLTTKSGVTEPFL